MRSGKQPDLFVEPNPSVLGNMSKIRRGSKNGRRSVMSEDFMALGKLSNLSLTITTGGHAKRARRLFSG